MSALANAPDFEPALGDLQDHLPDWWQTLNPDSEIYLILAALASEIDMLSELWEQPYLDQVITTATAQGLFHNFAFAWGVQNEQLPNVLSQLVAYLQARSAEDGSLQSMINTLTTLVDTTQNTTGGTVLAFAEDGSGLTFPEDGSGLIMYEFAPGDGPGTQQGLVFPADGSGLVFPINPDAIASDNVTVNDGTVPLGAGPGLTFASNQFVQVIPDYETSVMTVKVQNWLAFDRGAFARAVARFQDACWYPTVIEEVSSF